MPLPRLYLIRHGNTDWSETHRFTGRTDLPLNARGEQNARLLTARLNGLSFAHVFTSPLQRARKTCELAGFGSAAEVDPDLFEWDYGQFEGRDSIEVRREKPGWELFRDGAPGGESTQHIAARADRFISNVRQINGDVAAFSSGHICRVIAARWINQSLEIGGSLLCSTASISILGYEHGLGDPAFHLWNDDSSIPR
jgi:probable phosphoglycerate mutase